LSSFKLVLAVREGERSVKGAFSDGAGIGDNWELRDDAGNPIQRSHIGEDEFYFYWTAICWRLI
jgi:hypothetical protein